MGQYGLATGTLRSLREVCETDWAKERGAVVEVSDRGGGTLRLPNTPWRFASGDVGLRGEPRYRGEDNRAVLAELLGLDDAELDRLEADGVMSEQVAAPMTLRFPVTPMKAAIGTLPRRRRELGVRDQVGRLSHARVRRRRCTRSAEQQPARRHARSIPELGELAAFGQCVVGDHRRRARRARRATAGRASS